MNGWIEKFEKQMDEWEDASKDCVTSEWED